MTTPNTPTIASLEKRIRELEEAVATRDTYIDTLKGMNQHLSSELQERYEREAIAARRAHAAAAMTDVATVS